MKSPMLPADHQAAMRRVLALGRSGDAAVLPELIGMLRTPSNEVQRLAVSAIGKLAEFGADAGAAVAALAPLAMKARHPQTQQYAIRALKKYAGAAGASVQDLRDLARNSAPRDYVRAAAATTADAIAQAAADASAGVKHRCQRVIAAFGLRKELGADEVNGEQEKEDTMTEKSITPCRAKWKGTMTARERFNRQMHYQSVDRCFNMEFGYWEENYEVWSIFKKNGIKHENQANEFFGFDLLDWVWPNTWMNPSFPQTVVSETETTRTLMNGDGLLAEVPKDGHGTIPHYIKASIVTPDDWKRCKEERFRRDDPARKLDGAAEKRCHPAERDRPRGIYCGSMIGAIRGMLTFEGLAYACYDYPDMVEDMVETSCLLAEDMLDQLLPHVEFDFAAGWEDICFKNGPIVSLDFFTQVVVPRYKRIGRKLKAAGIDIWFTDCDGDVRPLLPGFLESGINCLFPYEVNSCVHPKTLCDEYGKDLRIMGGIDKIQLIKGREAIKAYLESVAPLVARGGYIPFCDHRCPPDVNENDYLFYLDLKERMFGMKA